MMGCPWSFLNYEQVIDRVRRQGNKSPRVTVHRILCRGTVDERVIQVLEGHDKSQAAFLKLLEGMRA
jgi:SNF2 family DNA or RNA helicase